MGRHCVAAAAAAAAVAAYSVGTFRTATAAVRQRRHSALPAPSRRPRAAAGCGALTALPQAASAAAASDMPAAGGAVRLVRAASPSDRPARPIPGTEQCSTAARQRACRLAALGELSAPCGSAARGGVGSCCTILGLHYCGGQYRYQYRYRIAFRASACLLAGAAAGTGTAWPP